MLPSSAGGRVTETAGFFALDAPTLASWFAAAVGASVREPGWDGAAAAIEALAPAPLHDLDAFIPLGDWTLVLTNGPLGTDLGVMHGLAAAELGITAIRATCTADDEGEHPARILEVCGPTGYGPLKIVRSIAAADDGGRWVFETAGEPLPFERPDRYRVRRKSARFPPELLHEYLRALGIPIDEEPDWPNASLIARAREGRR